MRISDLSSDVCSSDLEAAISIAEQRLAAAQRVATETNRRVVRALDPLFAAERAKTTVAQARIALDQARENARIARVTLASYWGGTADYSLDASPFDKLETAAVAGDIRPALALLAAERGAVGPPVRLRPDGPRAGHGGVTR